MKKQLSILIVMIMIATPLAAIPLSVGGDSIPVEAPMFAGGDGSIGDPYQISNVIELQSMELDLNAHYILINDINASVTSTWNGGAGFMPVGNETSGFAGSLDGFVDLVQRKRVILQFQTDFPDCQ